MERSTGRFEETRRRAAFRISNLVSFGALAACGLAACVGAIGGPGGEEGSGETTTTGTGGLTIGADGGVVTPTNATASLLPVRIRRLSNGEFDASIHALLGAQQSYASMLPSDVRQGSYNAGGFPAAGFTRNAAAVFDAVSTPQIEAAADSVAQGAVTSNLTKVAPCTGSDMTSCATTFISTFGAQAYRRPLTADEKSGLLAVYQAGAKDQTYAGGIQLVVTTILQSAGFLYLTELGGTVTNGVTQLTSYEVASALSYFLTGAPPDATLMQAAAADSLQDPKAVGTQASRLLKASMTTSMSQLAAFIEQWLGMDSPPGTSTGTMVSGDEMSGETTAYIEDIMANGDGSLPTLLSSPYSYVDPSLAQLYGLKAPSGSGFVKVANSQRPGILNQASFLTTFAHSSFSAPIKRGHLVRTQMLCDPIPPPDPSLKVNVAPPLPTTQQTTRQADVQHMTSQACSSCHTLMDPIGWGFENFDGNGAYRTMEAGEAIDSSGQVTSAAELTGTFTNGADLIAKLAASKTIEQCYLKHFADFAAATTDPGVESTFMNFWQSQPAATQSSLPQLVVAFVQSDLFLKRAVQ